MKKIILFSLLTLLITNCAINAETNFKKPNTGKKSSKKLKYVKSYGAIGDGKRDDTKAIQKALDDGNGIVVLERKHKISSSLINRNNNTITYLGSGKAEIISSSNSFYKIENQNNLTIKNIKTSSPFLSLSQPNKKYNKLAIQNCIISGEKGDGIVPTIKNYAIKLLEKQTIDSILIRNNNFKKTTIFYTRSNFEGAIKNLYFNGNTVSDFLRYVIAPKNIENIYFKDNSIEGNISIPGYSSRVFFRTGYKLTYIENNSFKNIISFKNNLKKGGEATVIYSSSGDIEFKNNIVENIVGDSNSHIISDKSTQVDNWIITNNIFNQKNVSADKQKLNAIIKGGNNKVFISENTFISPKMVSIQYGSIKDNVSNNSVIGNNKFLNIENNIGIYLLGNIENITIKNNILNGMTNPLNKKSGSDNRCRFIYLRNGKNSLMKNIEISSNEIHNISEDGNLFLSNTLGGKGIYNISFFNNIMTSGKAMLRYRNIKKHPVIHSLTKKENKLSNNILLEENN